MDLASQTAIFELLQTGELENIELAFQLIGSQGETVQQFLRPLENFLRANVFLQEYLLNNKENGENYWQEGYKRLFLLENFIISGQNRYNPLGLKLNKEIAYLQNMRLFTWHHSELKELVPELGKLQRLERFYTDHNQLKTLPVEICQLSKLRILSLNHNQLQNLPENIGELENLEFLYLHNNQLETLPESIGSLKNLKQLSLRDNPIKKELVPLKSWEKMGLPLHILKSVRRELGLWE